VAFNRYGQNYATLVSTVQVYPALVDLKPAWLPFIVSPVAMATRTAIIPQPNRYVPVCPVGTHQNPDQYLPCIECAPGTFQEKEGQQFCDNCPVNTYSDKSRSSFCTSCPNNTITIEKATTDPAKCICQLSFFSQSGAGGEACLTCPSNAICDGGLSWPRPTVGWYAEEDQPFKMYNCNPNVRPWGAGEPGFTGEVGWAMSARGDQ
jgi:hypothetical protein